MSEELKSALRATLEWIDAVPSDTVLPTMPGFDRDWVESLLAQPAAKEDLNHAARYQFLLDLAKIGYSAQWRNVGEPIISILFNGNGHDIYVAIDAAIAASNKEAT